MSGWSVDAAVVPRVASAATGCWPNSSAASSPSRKPWMRSRRKSGGSTTGSKRASRRSCSQRAYNTGRASVENPPKVLQDLATRRVINGGEERLRAGSDVGCAALTETPAWPRESSLGAAERFVRSVNEALAVVRHARGLGSCGVAKLVVYYGWRGYWACLG